MEIRCNSSARVQDLALPKVALALVGLALDERGRAAIDAVSAVARRVRTLEYDPASVELKLDGRYIAVDSLGHEIGWDEGEDILLEATTLGFVEVFLACKARLEKPGRGLRLVYAEPADYSRRNSRQVLHKRDFALSGEVEQFTAVPSAGMLVRGDRAARFTMFLGYEGARCAQVLEQTDVDPARCVAVFGVPAFRPGWEMHSFANNLLPVSEHGVKEVYYAGAQSPIAAYRVLERLLSSEPASRLLVAPIGTKPHGIGAALFACANPGTIGFVYDSPTRSQGRSLQVGTWHVFEVSK